MENIKFESALDVAKILDDKNNLRKYLAEFFDECDSLYEQSNGKYISIIRNEKTNYYNVDFDLVVNSFLKFLETLNLNTNTIANAKNLFDRLTPGTAKKSTVFLLNVLSYYGLTGQPKSGFFYISSLGKKIGSENYFQFNSIGINRIGLLELFGPEFEEKYIIPIAGNGKTVEVVALGPKGINTYKKNWGLKDENILTSALLLREKNKIWKSCFRGEIVSFFLFINNINNLSRIDY